MHSQPPTPLANAARTLRDRAEARFAEHAAVDGITPLSPLVTQQLLHELQVHQIELEMQNDELRRTHAELSVVQQHYVDLFELAPVAYVTLNVQGILVQANLTTANLLGTVRTALLKQFVFRYIFKQDQDIYYLRRKQILADGTPQSFDLRMQRADGSLFWAHLRLSTAPKGHDGAAFWLVITDITERKQAQALFHGLFDQSVFWACILDQQFKLIHINRVAMSFMEAPHEAVMGQYFPDLPWWSDKQNRDALLSALQQTSCGVCASFEACLSLTNDRHIVLMVRTMPIFLDDGDQVAFVGIDITQGKQAQAAFNASEQRFRRFFELNSSVMLLIDPASSQIIDSNLSATRFYGYPRDRLIGMPISDINTLEPEHIATEMQLAVHEERNHFAFTHRLASGELRQVEAYSTPIEHAGRTLLFSIVHDITTRCLLEQQVHHLAFHDALTQLPNRSLLSDRMIQAMAASNRCDCFCALMMLDLDNFKSLNDVHGHLVGDLLLLEVARRLTSCVREIDTVVRFGGDEFVVMLSELSADLAESTTQTAAIAEKIRLSLAQPYPLTLSQEGCPDTVIEHCCTASIGVLVFIGNDTSQGDILRWADMAMYQAKSDGGNRVRFYAADAPPS